MISGMDLIGIGAMVLIVAIDCLPDKPQRFIFGAILLIVGAFPVLALFKILSFDVFEYPAIGFAALFAVYEVTDILIKSGFKEETGALKALFFIGGGLVMIFTMIPWMNSFGALSFGLPKYAESAAFIVYIFSGVLTVVSVKHGN